MVQMAELFLRLHFSKVFCTLNALFQHVMLPQHVHRIHSLKKEQAVFTTLLVTNHLPVICSFLIHNGWK